MYTCEFMKNNTLAVMFSLSLERVPHEGEIVTISDLDGDFFSFRVEKIRCVILDKVLSPSVVSMCQTSLMRYELLVTEETE